jgi:short-subunit dehydrogenase involved in D-alanine esterification of teichoic acids
MGAKVVITGRNEGRLQETYNALDRNLHQMIVGDR